jgi:hypothetical protein
MLGDSLRGDRAGEIKTRASIKINILEEYPASSFAANAKHEIFEIFS